MNIMHLLLECPDDIFETINNARVAVLGGDWARAAKLLGYAAEAGETPLHDACQELADEFRKKAAK